MVEKGRTTTKKKQHEGTQKIRCTLALRRSAMVPARKHTCPTYWMMHPEAKANLSERRSWNWTGYLRLPDFYWRLQFFWRTPALEDTKCAKCVVSVLAKILMGPLFQVTWIHVYFPNDFEKYAFAYPLPSTSCLRNSAIYVDVLHLILRWFHLHHLYVINFWLYLFNFCLYGIWLYLIPMKVS